MGIPKQSFASSAACVGLTWGTLLHKSCWPIRSGSGGSLNCLICPSATGINDVMSNIASEATCKEE